MSARPFDYERPVCQLDELIRWRLPAEFVNLTPSRKTLAAATGSHQSRFRGRGMDFDEVRRYQPGDDIRSIDWRVTARYNEPHTKLFREEREKPVMVLCDQSPSQFFGSRRAFKSVVAADAAALIAWATLKKGDRLGGLVFSGDTHHEIRPRRSKRTVMQYLRALTQFNQALTQQQGNAFGLKQALQQAQHIIKPGSQVYLISDFFEFDADAYKYLYMLSRHNNVVAIFTYDPMEAELPKAGVYSITNGHDRRRLNTSEPGLVQAFNQQFQQRLDNIRQELGKLSIPLLLLSTQDNAADLFTASRQGVRR